MNPEGRFESVIESAGRRQINKEKAMKSLLKKLGILTLLAFLSTGGLLRAQVADFVYFNPCKDQVTHFVNTSTYPSGVTAYEWNFGDGSALQFGLEVDHQFTQKAVFPVTLTLYNGLVVVDQITKNVAIYRVPDASFTASVACYGEAVSFTNTSNCPDGQITSWEWSFGDGEGDILMDVNHFYSQPGIYSVSLTAESNYGCADIFTAPVAVYQLPDANITADRLVVCEGEPIQLSVDDQYEKVIWSTNPDYTSPSIESFNVAVDFPVGTHLVVAKVYEIHADYPFFQVCQDVDTIEVKVNPQPEILISASETQVLPGAIVQFGVTSSNTILENFLWTPTSIMPNPYISNPVAVMHTTTSVSVQVSDAAGCAATASILIEVDLKPNTVLTPNADGKNDTWYVSASGLSGDYQLLIYNRWGAEVLNQMGYSNDWDGTRNGEQLPDGAYYYIIKHGEVVYTGSINLLR